MLWAPAHRVTDSDRKEKKAVWRRFTLGGFVVTAYDTVHSGRPFRRQPHCSMLVENRKEGEAFFVCGDAALYPELADRVRSETQEIQAAFVMIYQLLEKESLAFLTRLSPKRILLYHLPAKEEDVYAMLPMAREVLLRNPLPGKRIEVLRQHVWITERPVRR